MIFLTFRSGPHAGHQVEVDTDLIEIGRDPAGAIALQDEKCSWKHCRIERVDGVWTVADQGSRNGTCVNGVQLPAEQPFRLSQGDVVRVGHSEIEVRYPEEARSIQIGHMARPAGAGAVILSVAAGPLQGSAIRTHGDRLMVGSAPGCDVVLPGESVAPQAATLRRTGDHWTVERLDDTTDIRVYGGLLVFSAPLPQGAILQIGAHIMDVSYDDAGSAEKATMTTQLSDADRERLAAHIESFAGVLRQSDRGSLEIRAQDGWDVSISLGEDEAPAEGAATMALHLSGDATRAISTTESEALADAVEQFKLAISGGTEAASALTAAATGLRARPATPSERTMAMDVGDAAQIKAMVEEMRAGRAAAPAATAAPAAPAAPRAIGTEGHANPTMAWEGVGDKAFLVERADTSGDPIPVPEQHRLRAKLIFVSGPHAERKVYLGKDTVTIGRASDNFVPLVDGLVSRYHAEVRSNGKNYELVTSPEARNKPTVNGRPVTDRMRLDHRDLITIGGSVIEFHASGIDPLKENPLQTVMLPQPRYAYMGQVVVQWNVTIGRDPGSDLYLDHESVERSHAELQFFDGGFRLLDKSVWGSFVNGKRVVDTDLSDGDVIQIGGYKLALQIDGLRCSMDVSLLEADLSVPDFAPDLDSAAPERVIHRTTRSDDGDKDKKPKKKQLQWVPPRDVQRSTLGPLVVVVGVILVLGVAAWAATSRNVFFLNKPLSQSHDSMAFMKAVEANKGGELKAECTACHTPFGGAVSDACASCHTEQHARDAHVDANESGEAEISCLTCHTEHQGAERRTALLEGAACADCHTSRHEKLLAVTAGPLKVDAPMREDDAMPVGMVVSLRADVSTPDLHKLHEGLDRRCAGCHSNEDQSGPVDPRTSCLRCHDVREQLADLRCNGCHGEHRATMTRMASVGGPAFGKPMSWTGGGVLVLLLFLPLGIVIVFHQAARRVVERRAARRAEEEALKAPKGGGEGGVKLVHNINIDKCVGCASCVNACPHDVLALEPKRHKSTVVRLENCNQCRACEQICPSGALTMAPAGAPPRMVELPDLDSHYMTNLPGVYLIGEASGKSLVKNANNLGRRVVEHMIIEGAGKGAAAAAGVDVEVIAVGSGPGGLAVGITALKMGLKHVIFEKDRKFSSTIQTYPKGKELLAEPPEVENIGPLPVWDSYKEEILGAWEKELTKYPDLDLRTGHEVTNIVARPQGGFEITTTKGVTTCLRVVLATGTRGNPRGLKIPGGDSEKLHYVLVDPEEHKGDSCMVVGGGDSAVEAAMALAEPALGNKVAISYRRGDFGRIKPRNQERLNAMVEAGQLTLYMETNPAEVKDGAVVLKRNDGELVEVPNDVLYCMLGADPPVKWLQTIGVRYVQKPESWSPGPTDDLSFLELERVAS